nr:helix-turn-helix domain-containing protein [Candidatus Freyrarchaeum guaymaensis]
MREPLNIEELFYVLGNPTRRLLLKLLSMGPHYPFQLARLLNVSQKVIMDHLRILEEKGLVVKVGSEKSSIGPERTYYAVNNFFVMNFSLGPSLYELKVMEVRKSERRKGAVLGEVGGVASEVKELAKRLKEVNSEIKKLDEKMLKLLNIKQELSFRISELIDLLELSYPEKAILLSLVNKGCASLEDLSEELDMREKYVKEFLNHLRSLKLVEEDVENPGLYMVALP